jgi:hypothetical protein
MPIMVRLNYIKTAENKENYIYRATTYHLKDKPLGIKWRPRIQAIVNVSDIKFIEYYIL